MAVCLFVRFSPLLRSPARQFRDAAFGGFLTTDSCYSRHGAVGGLLAFDLSLFLELLLDVPDLKNRRRRRVFILEFLKAEAERF